MIMAKQLKTEKKINLNFSFNFKNKFTAKTEEYSSRNPLQPLKTIQEIFFLDLEKKLKKKQINKK